MANRKNIVKLLIDRYFRKIVLKNERQKTIKNKLGHCSVTNLRHTKNRL